MLALGLVARPSLAAPALVIEAVGPGQYRLSWPAAESDFTLQEAAAVGPSAAWVSSNVTPTTTGATRSVTISSGPSHRFYRLSGIGQPSLTRILETSPAHEENGVAVTRETILRFSRPLAPDSLLDTTSLRAVVDGRPLLTRVELASDRATASLFYLEPVPANAQVTVTFDGFHTLDQEGNLVDADGDGRPGGFATISFTTLNNSPLATTGVTGQVLASEKNADGTDRPLPGVTITVDGAEESVRTVTDAQGRFTLIPSPAGRFFVHVDGRTSPLSVWPNGAYYPFVGKAWDARPGQTNNLAGGSGLIYLPHVSGQALTPVSEVASTAVTFPPEVLAANPGLAGVGLEVPPGSLFADDGTRGGRVGIAPVAPDRLPEPLPPGLAFPLVITIQTDGPQNFDRPVPVRFPNLPDPLTGVILPPGAKTALWSFNHDTGNWEVQGTMTVSADGKYAETDPGVGVRQPGWHGAAAGGPAGGPRRGPRPKPNCTDRNFNGVCDDKDSDPCEVARLQAIFAGTDALAGAAGMLPDTKGALASCALGLLTSVLQGVRDCGIDPKGCKVTYVTKSLDFAVGCAANFAGELKPIADAAITLKSLFDVGLAYQSYQDCLALNADSRAVARPAKPNGLVALPLANPFRLQYELETRLGEWMDATYGDPVWHSIPMGDAPLFAALVARIREAAAPASPGGATLTESERTALLALPRPQGVSPNHVTALAERCLALLAGNDVPGFDPAKLELVSQRLVDILQSLTAAGWTQTHEGYARGWALLQSLIAESNRSGVVGTPSEATTQSPSAGDAPELPERALSWFLYDLSSGFARRGTLSPSGSFQNVILAANTEYLVGYADPATGWAGVARFRSFSAGSTTLVPHTVLAGPPTAPDGDADGLSDLAERVLGSDPDAPDTDGDGRTDGAAFLAGDSPLGANALPLGVIANTDSPGTAYQVAAWEDLAVVADGPKGVAVYDLRNPRQPIRLGAIPIGDTRVVAFAGRTAVAATATNLVVIDLRDANAPVLIGGQSTGILRARAIAMAGPLAYYALDQTVMALHVSNGAPAGAWPLDGAVQDLAVEGEMVYALTAKGLNVLTRQAGELVRLSQITLAGTSAPRETGRKLFVGGGRAYVGYFGGFHIVDVSNPANPRLLASPPRTQLAIHDLAENGAGLLACISSFAGEGSLAFSLYDVRTGTTTTNFLTSLETPGTPYALTLHRGLAYVADDQSGLTVINYLTPDTARQPPTIALGRPLDTRPELEIGATTLVGFRATDDVQVRDVELFIDGSPVTSVGAFPFQLPLTTPLPAPGQTSLVLRARARDTAGREAWTPPLTVQLTPDVTPPAIIRVFPVDVSESQPGQHQSVGARFSEKMNRDSVLAGFRLTAAGPDGRLGTADDQVLSPTPSYDDDTDSFMVSVLTPGLYRAELSTRVTDASGIPLAASRAWSFRILPPVLLATSPANNSQHRPGNPTSISARFSLPMDAASLRQGGFVLEEIGADGQPGTSDDLPIEVASLRFTTVSNRMEFLPSPSLASGRYRARFTAAARDALGNALALPLPAPWNFTVLSPEVVAVSPLDGYARPLGTTRSVTVSFSDAMNPATLASGIQLSLTNGTPVSNGQFSYDPASRTAMLEFPEPLAGGEYQVRVTSAAKDVFGNAVRPEKTTRFGIHGPVSWAVDADGRWEDVAKWTPTRPLPGDAVIIDRPAGAFTVNHTSGNTLLYSLTSTEAFQLTRGSLTLQSDSLVSGPLLVQQATLLNQGALRIAGNGILGVAANLAGGGQTVVSGTLEVRTGSLGDRAQVNSQTFLVQGGRLAWTAGDLSTAAETPVTWIVGPGGTYEAVVGPKIRDWQSFRGILWNDRGTIRQTGATNTLRWFGLAVTNNGTWSVEAGHGYVQGTLDHTGTLTIAPNASLEIESPSGPGASRFAPGSVIEGGGNLTMNRMTMTLAGRYALTGNSRFIGSTLRVVDPLALGSGPLALVNTAATFTQPPPSFAFPVTLTEGTLRFEGPTSLADFRWEFGTVETTTDLTIPSPLVVGIERVGNGAIFAGPGRLRVLAGMDLRRSFTLGAGAVLEHSGSSTWNPLGSAADLQLETGSTFRNLPDGRFAMVTNRFLSGNGTFENRGALIKSANSITNTFRPILENLGTLEVAGGKLQLGAGGTLGGNIQVAAGAVLELLGANRRPGWQLSGAFTGTGTLTLLGGTNAFTGSLNGPRLAVAGGILELPADLTLDRFDTTAGDLRLAGSLRLVGTNHSLHGSGTRFRGPGPVRNEGRVSGSTALFEPNVENAGTWEQLSSVRPRFAALFRNLPGGTLIVSNITGEISSTPATSILDNAGLLLKLGSGTATLDTPFTNRGSILITGTLALQGSFTQTSNGLTQLRGGSLMLVGTSLPTLSGEIHGPGTFGRPSGNVASLDSNARLRPGGPEGTGILQMQSVRTSLGKDSVVHLRLGGTTPGSGHDQVKFSQTADLAGHLVLEFLPGKPVAVGQKFRIVEAVNRFQNFRSDFQVLGLPDTMSVRLNYLPTAVEAEIIPR